MSETKEPSKLRVALVQARPYLPLIAAAMVVVAVWLAWSGWLQLQDGARRDALQLDRDNAAGKVAATLTTERQRMEERIASPAMQTALADDDLVAARAVLSRDWPGLDSADVVHPDLQEAYGALGKGGFGRVAALESAIVEDKTVVWVVREEGQSRLALTAPVKRDGRVAGVAFVRLPAKTVTSAIEAVTPGGSGYLSLRQGSFSVVEVGDTQYANAAERLATPIAGTGLRVAAAMPPPPAQAFGLGSVPSLIAAAILLLLAYITWRLPARIGKLALAADETAPTLSQVLTDAPVTLADPLQKDIKDMPKAPAVAIDRGIFRAYDIRGVVGTSLDTGVAELIGHAIGSLMAEKDLTDIVVGRDGRLSGPDMVAGLTEGLRRAGRNVIDIGMVPTPVVYFGAYHLRTGCCVSVTGSHNPPDYNGFKIVVGGETLSGDAITDLYARIADDRLHVAQAPGSRVEREIADAYVERIAGDVQADRRLKIVVDAGNGVAGELGPRVLEAIGAEVEPLHCEIDGTFPNHHPDPSEPENLEDLIAAVGRVGADLGIAFDGDGDRLGVVTKDGRNIFPDRLLMLFAGDVLERNPGAVIVYDVKCTGRLPGYILRHGGSPLMWKTGHSLIKAKMRETEAELAGEMSGHFFFSERWYGFDDGLYAAARLVEILANSVDGTPTEILDALPDGISTPEIKVAAPGGDPHAFVARFLEQAQFDGARLSTIDGLRADWSDGWGLVRASNTTPVLVLRFDADSDAALARIQAEFRERMLAIDPELSLPF